VTVDGTGSTLTNDYYLYVGENGAGRLNIAGGGHVASSYPCLGCFPSAQG